MKKPIVFFEFQSADMMIKIFLIYAVEHETEMFQSSLSGIYVVEGMNIRYRRDFVVFFLFMVITRVFLFVLHYTCIYCISSENIRHSCFFVNGR